MIYGLYLAAVLPVGLINAPSQLMPAMNWLLASNPMGLYIILVFLDDVLILCSLR